MRSVTVKAASKLNLTLGITGTRGNMHTLDMLCTAVDLFEKVTVTRQDDIRLLCNVADIPTDRSNTAVKAAEAFFAATGLRGGALIEIEKNVPVGAGMGGGSADAAGVLVALNALYGTDLSTERLCEIGLAVGSDVPVCIVGGTCRVRGTGDVLDRQKPLKDVYFVAAMAGGAVSTAKAYSDFDRLGTPSPADTGKAIAALEVDDYDSFYRLMRNDLEHSSTVDMAALKNHYVASGCKATLMTGSGAVVYGVYDNEQQAKNACRDGMFLLRPFDYGVEILSSME